MWVQSIIFNHMSKKKTDFEAKTVYRVVKRHTDEFGVYQKGEILTDLSDQKALRWVSRGIITAETLAVPVVEVSDEL